MKILKYAVAIFFTLVLLYLARANSRGRSEFVSQTDNGITFDFNTVPKGPERSKATIRIKITGLTDSTLSPEIRISKFGQDSTTRLYLYKNVPLTLENPDSSIYSIEVSTGPRGGKLYYYFEIRDNTGGRRAWLTDENERPFVLKFIGEIPPVVLGMHLFFIFSTVFLITLASVEGLAVLRGKGNLRRMMKNFLWATITLFIGGYPVGFAMNWYAFAGIWEGVPFGTDATDNKTQLIFVYLLFLLLAGLRTLSGRFGKDAFSEKVLARLGVFAFLVQLVIYLIPHSIQFDPTSTYAFCYGFMGLLAVIYMVGLIKSGSAGKKKA